MPKDKLRTLVYNSDVNTLLQDGLEKVINGYTTFEEVIKLIELDDDLEDNRISAYKYDLNRALEETEMANTSQISTNDINEALNKQNNVTPQVQSQPTNQQIKPAITTQQPIVQQQVTQPVQNKTTEDLLEDELSKTQILYI